MNTHAFILKSDKLIADYELSLIAPDTVAGDLHWGSIEQYTAIVNGVEGYLSSILWTIPAWVSIPMARRLLWLN